MAADREDEEMVEERSFLRGRIVAAGDQIKARFEVLEEEMRLQGSNIMCLTLVQVANAGVDTVFRELISAFPNDDGDDALACMAPTNDVHRLQQQVTLLKQRLINMKLAVEEKDRDLTILRGRGDRHGQAVDYIRKTLYSEVCLLREELKDRNPSCTENPDVGVFSLFDFAELFQLMDGTRNPDDQNEAMEKSKATIEDLIHKWKFEESLRQDMARKLEMKGLEQQQLMKRLAEVESELEDNNKKWQHETGMARSVVKDLKQQVDALMLDGDELTSQVEDLKKSEHALTERVEVLQSENKSLKEKIEELTGDVEKGREEMAQKLAAERARHEVELRQTARNILEQHLQQQIEAQASASQAGAVAVAGPPGEGVAVAAMEGSVAYPSATSPEHMIRIATLQLDLKRQKANVQDWKQQAEKVTKQRDDLEYKNVNMFLKVKEAQDIIDAQAAATKKAANAKQEREQQQHERQQHRKLQADYRALHRVIHLVTDKYGSMLHRFDVEDANAAGEPPPAYPHKRLNLQEQANVSSTDTVHKIEDIDRRLRARLLKDHPSATRVKELEVEKEENSEIVHEEWRKRWRRLQEYVPGWLWDLIVPISEDTMSETDIAQAFEEREMYLRQLEDEVQDLKQELSETEANAIDSAQEHAVAMSQANFRCAELQQTLDTLRASVKKSKKSKKGDKKKGGGAGHSPDPTSPTRMESESVAESAEFGSPRDSNLSLKPGKGRKRIGKHDSMTTTTDSAHPRDSLRDSIQSSNLTPVPRSISGSTLSSRTTTQRYSVDGTPANKDVQLPHTDTVVSEHGSDDSGDHTATDVITPATEPQPRHEQIDVVPEPSPALPLIEAAPSGPLVETPDLPAPDTLDGGSDGGATGATPGMLSVLLEQGEGEGPKDARSRAASRVSRVSSQHSHTTPSKAGTVAEEADEELQEKEEAVVRDEDGALVVREGSGLGRPPSGKLRRMSRVSQTQTEERRISVSHSVGVQSHPGEGTSRLSVAPSSPSVAVSGFPKPKSPMTANLENDILPALRNQWWRERVVCASCGFSVAVGEGQRTDHADKLYVPMWLRSLPADGQSVVGSPRPGSGGPTQQRGVPGSPGAAQGLLPQTQTQTTPQSQGLLPSSAEETGGYDGAVPISGENLMQNPRRKNLATLFAIHVQTVATAIASPYGGAKGSAEGDAPGVSSIDELMQLQNAACEVERMVKLLQQIACVLNAEFVTAVPNAAFLNTSAFEMLKAAAVVFKDTLLAHVSRTPSAVDYIYVTSADVANLTGTQQNVDTSGRVPPAAGGFPYRISDEELGDCVQKLLAPGGKGAGGVGFASPLPTFYQPSITRKNISTPRTRCQTQPLVPGSPGHLSRTLPATASTPADTTPATSRPVSRPVSRPGTAAADPLVRRKDFKKRMHFEFVKAFGRDLPRYKGEYALGEAPKPLPVKFKKTSVLAGTKTF
eukprot:TRINITY_DN1313_c0_g1_i1.p1 TRINITY_DN1313_c0_g1~~TRINITY_DN1313_c0_g1_i1.p1  ORF type:complete len:1445 (+),score=479.09 TRINITY_DN1313_c0_g1_i1:106-4440(+)